MTHLCLYLTLFLLSLNLWLHRWRWVFFPVRFLVSDVLHFPDCISEIHRKNVGHTFIHTNIHLLKQRRVTECRQQHLLQYIGWIPSVLEYVCRIITLVFLLASHWKAGVSAGVCLRGPPSSGRTSASITAGEMSCSTSSDHQDKHTQIYKIHFNFIHSEFSPFFVFLHPVKFYSVCCWRETMSVNLNPSKYVQD